VHQDPANQHQVVVLALSGVVAFDLAIGPQVFGNEGSGYQVTVCAPEPGLVTTKTLGFSLHVSSGLEALARAGTVLVPGFDRSPASAPTLAALRAAQRRGARIASICTGAFALAEAGLLDGQRATTHWFHAAELAARYPQVTVDPAVLYVDNGQVLTSAGLAAGLDLCLYLISLDRGEAAALDRARHLVTPLHRAGGQAQFIPGRPADGDGELAAVTVWARERLHLPITVTDLARQAMQAPRTFSRNFQAQLGVSPHAWLTSHRLQAACALLENDALSMDEVARRSGLGTAANFRLHFRRAFATTPTAYRASFSA
jgi:AraC family transcriptional activator FtrA